MVIIKGNVWTLYGPIPVEDLKVGDRVLDRKPSVREILDIQLVPVDKALMFKNHSFAVSADTQVYTAFGPKLITEETSLLARREDFSVMPVKAYLEDVDLMGYKLTIKDGSDLYVNGYNMQL
ncbi:MAG: hypothetical protein IKB96_04065 [Prevotella sp.]|nr:hypothetical protein [Prevotella sp.]